MTTVQLSELGALAEKVKNGETIEVLDGERVVAKVVPERSSLEEQIRAAMDRQPDIPDWFFEEEPPQFSGSVLEQLLKDRERDW